MRQQIYKDARIADALGKRIWKNYHFTINSKVRIYKARVRLVMTYTVETRADIAETKIIARTNEMKVLIAITGHTLRDQSRSSKIRGDGQIEEKTR